MKQVTVFPGSGCFPMTGTIPLTQSSCLAVVKKDFTDMFMSSTDAENYTDPS